MMLSYKKGIYHFLILLFLLSLSCTTPYSKNDVRRSRGSSNSEPKINVLLAENVSTAKILLSGNYNLKTPEGKYQFNDESEIINLLQTSNGFELSSANRQLRYKFGDKVSFMPDDKESNFSINNISYSGQLHISSEKKSIVLINTIFLERYLMGVVPNEIPSSRETGFDAIKAQAVAARTYAIKRMAYREDGYFHVYSDHRDQVYHGILNNASLATKAIEQTRGEVMFYQDQPIDAVFYSTSGGITEDYASVWGDTSRPYLTVKMDFIDEELSKNSPYFQWQIGFTAKEIERNLLKWINSKPLSVEDENYYEDRPLELTIISRTEGKRVSQIGIKSGENEIILNGIKIRQFFTRGNGKILPSTLFTIAVVQDEFIFSGRGFGHGVGMSQYSAIRLSEKSYNYKQILGFYYPNTQLIKLY